jgi:cell division protein FtsL
MTFKNYEFSPRKRRGLSSVVGALLFVVLMVATFAVLGVALDSQTNIVDTGRDVANLDLKIQQEKFTANMYANSTDFLIVDINNDGQNAVEISTVF